MKYCNININSKHNFTYAVGYAAIDHPTKYRYAKSGDDIYMIGVDYGGKYNTYIRDTNVWLPSDFQPGDISSVIDMNTHSNLRVFFPLFSIEIYNNSLKYAVSAYIYIGRKKVILCSKVLSRSQALAVDRELNRYNNTYLECIDINIPNPYEIMYSDDWLNFREVECNCDNSDSCILGISIIPVFDNNGTYCMDDVYTEGQNSINISKPNNYLGLHISHNIMSKDPQSRITCESIYNNKYNMLTDYIKNIYKLSDISIKYEVILKDNSNKEIIKLVSKFSNEDSVEFDIKDLYIPHDIDKVSIAYGAGISLSASLNVYNNEIITDNENEKLVLYLLSNEIPITDEIIGYFIEKDINYVNLQNINMNVYNINAVSKTINNVVKLNNVENSKSNIIQPVFFRVEKLYSIVVHPDVTENICINLDQFKSKVDFFLIRIDGVSFSEVGRTNSGVVFEIQGNQLPKIHPTGTYYITDQVSNVIATGKYTCEY